jgi:hypothetical protein
MPVSNPFVLFLAPLAAVAVGVFVSRQSGVSYLAFLPNVIALFLGTALLLRSTYFASFTRRNLRIVSSIAVFLMVSSLLSPGTQSVHRWVSIGSFALNVSMAVVPIVLFGLVYGSELESMALTSALSVIFVLQPDAGQATAFASSAAVIFLSEGALSSAARWRGLLLVAVSWAITWSRPDPLTPVEHVERVLRLGFAQGLVSSFACLFAVLCLFLPIIWLRFQSSKPKLRVLSLSYFVYFLVSFAVTEIGNFPVPVIGAGAAPVIGWYLMMALARETYD